MAARRPPAAAGLGEGAKFHRIGLAVDLAAPPARPKGLHQAPVEGVAATIGLPKARLSTVVLSGGVYHELLRDATEWRADLIVVGSHRPGMSDYLLGSNAKTIVRPAQCSVLVVRD